MNLLTVQPDFSAIPGIHAKQTAGNLRSPGSHQAGKPQHLTLTYLKADRFKNTVSLQILHLQDDLSRFQVLPVEDIFDFPAYHQFRQLVLIGLTNRQCLYLFTIPKHCDLIRNLKNLGHSVGNVDHSQPLFFHLSNDLKQFFFICLCDGRSGLIHDHQPGI